MSTLAARLNPAQWKNAEAVLRQAPVAYLAVVEDAPESGRTAAVPYVVPVNFAYERLSGTADTGGGGDPDGAADAPSLSATRLLFHTGAGRKTEALARNPRVCLAVTTEVGFDAGPSPCEDGFAYRSVLVWGRAAPLEGPVEKEQALSEIVAKYDPGAAGRAFDGQDFERTLVFAVSIDDVSYKERVLCHPG
jgi:nitroimidazol reductase NimA-like FMN-containing flavoprotein (pyridoxamine 5'-phosphate oxidase superfamily)